MSPKIKMSPKILIFFFVIFSGDRSVCVEQQVGDSVKKVEVILSSYHSAADFREELIHGFILVYSTRRRASIATLRYIETDIEILKYCQNVLGILRQI